LTDEVTFRANELAKNIPDTGDLLTDEVTFRANELAKNIPDTGDLLTDEVTFRANELAKNIPDTGDLLTDDAVFRANELTQNIPDTGDLLIDQNKIRNDSISSNVSSTGDLLTDQQTFRNNLVSANAGLGDLGVNIEGAGTSTFLGVSKLLVQGTIFRNLLTSRNIINVSPLETDSLNRQQQNSFVFNTILAGDNGNNLQANYGTNIPGKNQSDVVRIGGKLFGVNTKNPQGSSFDDIGGGSQYTINYSAGDISTAIRNYNIQKNPFNILGLAPGGIDALQFLQGSNVNGFQDLIHKTIGSFRIDGPVLSQSLTTPNSIIVKNNGQYLAGAPENTLRPFADPGTPESFAAKTVAGNPFDEPEFESGARGLKYVMNNIRSSTTSSLLKNNFDPQNSTVYVSGRKNGTDIISRQKYTVANPYAPIGAGKLIFSIKNYSMHPGDGDTMFFPPYIKDFKNSYNADWNTIKFLGRPEPIYTYNSSEREGSISFVVLTDYTQTVEIGNNYDSPTGTITRTTVSIPSHFTDIGGPKNQALADAIKAQIKSKTTDLNNIQSHQTSNESTSDIAEDNQKKATLTNEISTLQQKLADVESNNGTPNYSSAGPHVNNINTFMTSDVVRENGDLNSVPANTVNRINAMKKDLLFQPSYFSGDKVDFLQKIEFLAKTTRPSRSNSSSGFSFTKPPVCHMHLGTWINNDVIISNVSLDYAESPWTLDGDGKVQPMWAIVSMSFKIVGAFGDSFGPPLTSTDKGGFHSVRTSST
jgi:hypothetical protein